MKIAQVCPFFLPVEGGVERHVFNLSRGLIQHGHEVHVFTSARTRNQARLPQDSRLGEILVHRFEPLVQLGEFGSFWPGITGPLMTGGFDVIHAHSFRHPHTDISAISSKVARSRSIMTSHSPFHPQGVRGAAARSLVPVYDRLLAPLTLRSFDKVVCLTEMERDSLSSLGAPRNNLVVIPNGVDARHFSPGPFEDFRKSHGLGENRIIFYLGRVNRTKGVHVLLNAFAKISPLFPDDRLVIAGPLTSRQESEYATQLKVLAGSLGVSDRVHFLGALSEEEKLAALDSCSIFVLPSLYEPFGIVLLEAAAHGKPIIATKTDGPSSIIKDNLNGILVGPGSVDELSRALIRLLSDPGYCRMISEAARETAKGYGWDNIVAKVEALY